MGEQHDKGNETVKDGAVSATTTPPQQKPETKPPKTGQLPPFKVLLHNDDVNDMEHVVLSLLKVLPLSVCDAEQRMLEAHSSGTSLLVVTHRERAELYQEQLQTYNLSVTIEPDA